MGKNFFDLNSGGIYRPQNGKSKYYSNDKTDSRILISMTENTLVTLFMSCVEILTFSMESCVELALEWVCSYGDGVLPTAWASVPSLACLWMRGSSRPSRLDTGWNDRTTAHDHCKPIKERLFLFIFIFIFLFFYFVLYSIFILSVFFFNHLIFS